ncbi:sulfotransferase domain-containing protein [Winogradskyella sp. SYSU M77433]|uniref:sulfotransferase domain-containing protein n=1 Tax=Winogradskyella sp. SYSU M77433 TaxID=3042722 RepID=UPI00247FC733|nr:sulfotransferase domain-containing protein [Winogradskyella sp. SYSU M77433]MDH7913710.1 sulfotransferase domain-containing protein [Winogradskyella sp. SYSU M77433]|tara:strand:+ start:998 stop:1819 length:822 start_codon:yes stop_codon:yes gene_type:complete
MIKYKLKKFEYATRLLFVNSLTFVNKSPIIVEYPKSGGTWLAQLIAGSLDIPFPRNTYPKLVKSVYHSHYLPKFLIKENKNIIWLLRDGRDIMVSSYFHHLIWNDKNRKDKKLVDYYRGKLNFDDFDDIKTNLPVYIDFLFKNTPSKMTFFNHPGNWGDYNKAWLNFYRTRKNIYLVRYEDLLEDTYKEIEKLNREFLGVQINEKSDLEKIIKKYSFENQTKRKRGNENTTSFLRKGIVGDWKNYFNEDAKSIFKKHHGEILIELGYEKDLNW